MGQFIGINSFVTEPLARQNVAGSIREYHDWQWDEGERQSLECVMLALLVLRFEVLGFHTLAHSTAHPSNLSVCIIFQQW
jgi:hypothetical protein